MPIQRQALNQLIFDAFTRNITWLEASTRFPLEDFILAFQQTRASMLKTLDGLNDQQVDYQELSSPLWSLSETVTHLIYSQNYYYNSLLDITNLALPHILEAARGFGEGSKRGVPAAKLLNSLQAATETIMAIIEATRQNADPKRTNSNTPFGEMNYHSWILTLLAHEIDHVRQAVVMRRLAKAAIPSSG